MERPNKCNDGRLVGMICSAIVVTRRVLLGPGRMGSSTGEYAARMLRGFIECWRSHLCRLPRPVFVHLKRSFLGRPPPVTMAVCFMPAAATPPKQARSSLMTRVPSAMLALA